MIRDMLVFFAITTRVVGAVNYVDCSSTEAVASINACRGRYNNSNTNDTAATCYYYSHVSLCVPGACCGDSVYAQALLNMRSMLKDRKISCDVGCSDRTRETDSCDSADANKMVTDCQSAVRSTNLDLSCSYYTRMASCVPPTCCNTVSYALGLAFFQAKLNSLALPNCNMVCGASLSMGARVLGGMQAVMLVALMAVLFIETK